MRLRGVRVPRCMASGGARGADLLGVALGADAGRRSSYASLRYCRKGSPKRRGCSQRLSSLRCCGRAPKKMLRCIFLPPAQLVQDSFLQALLLVLSTIGLAKSIPLSQGDPWHRVSALNRGPGGLAEAVYSKLRPCCVLWLCGVVRGGSVGATTLASTLVFLGSWRLDAELFVALGISARLGGQVSQASLV